MSLNSKYFLLLFLSLAVPGAILGDKLKDEKNRMNKVVYVDIKKLFSFSTTGTPAGLSEKWVAQLNDLRSKMEPMLKELEGLESQLKNGLAEYNKLKSSGVASKDSIAQKEEAIAKLEYTGQYRTREIQEFQQRKLMEIQESLLSEVGQVCKKIGEREGYVIEAADKVLYAPSELYITDKVAKELNEKYTQEKAAASKEKKAAETKK